MSKKSVMTTIIVAISLIAVKSLATAKDNINSNEKDFSKAVLKNQNIYEEYKTGNGKKNRVVELRGEIGVINNKNFSFTTKENGRFGYYTVVIDNKTIHDELDEWNKVNLRGTIVDSDIFGFPIIRAEIIKNLK